MSLSHLKGSTIRLHLDETNRLWLEGSASTIFLLEKPFQDLGWLERLQPAKTVRVLGFQRNAKLIKFLYDAQSDRKLGCTIQVGTPTICPKKLQADPAMVLQHMQQLVCSPSMGGWHEVSEPEYRAYCLTAAVETMETDPDFGDRLRLLIADHPTWRALSFLPIREMFSTARMLSEIIDPRWYADHQHPNRKSKLLIFMGLTPKIVDDVLSERSITTPAMLRAQWLIESWAGSIPLESPPKHWLHEPNKFLYRTCLQKGGGSTGVLRASQRYLNFLREIWLDSLQGTHQHDPLFEPTLFFETPAECRAFKMHCAAFEKED